MAQPPRRKYPSRNKFTPWLTVMMRRTESFNDPNAVVSATSTITLSLTLDFNTYEYDMYLDNVIWYARFVESGTQSLAVGGAGGNTYFYNEVFPDAVSITGDDVGIIHYSSASLGDIATIRWIDTAQYKFGTGSLHLRSEANYPYPSYSYLVFNAYRNLATVGSDLDFTTSDPFTFEYWFRLDATQSDVFCTMTSYGGWQDYNGGKPAWGFNIAFSSSATVQSSMNFYESDNTGTSTATYIYCPKEEWHHLAFVKREARHMDVYLNGHRIYNLSLTSIPAVMNNLGGQASSNLFIGGVYARDPPRVVPFHGCIDEVRYTSRVARYTSDSFTLATAQYRFKPWHTGFINHLCNYTLEMGAWDLHDGAGRSFNRYGSPGGDPPRADYSTNCMAFDGSGDAIEWSATATSDFDFSLGDMTVDIKAVPIGSGSNGDPTPVLLQIGSDNAAQTIRLCLDGNTPANVKLQKGTGGIYTDILSASASISSSERALISVVRRNNIWALFKNGVSFGSATNTFSVSGNIWIGNGSGLTNSFSGWVNGTRTIKNGCQYVQDFSPVPRAFNYRDWSLE